MKHNIRFFALALGLAALTAPYNAHARNCELPHEQVQLKCGGEMPNAFDPEAEPTGISAVKKARPISEIMKEYRGRVDASGALVEKAKDEYRAYLASKSR